MASEASFVIREIKDIPIEADGPYFLTEWVNVAIPEGLESFQILSFGPHDASIQVTDLVDPYGIPYVRSRPSYQQRLNAYSFPMLENIQSPNRADAILNGMGSLIVPNNPGLGAPAAGLWRFRAIVHKTPTTKSASFLLVGKPQGSKANGIEIRARIQAGSYWAENKESMNRVLEAAQRMLGSAGLEIRLLSSEEIDFHIRAPIHVPDDMEKIALEKNSRDAINVYFMGEMASYNKPINGFSCIGGPIDVPATYNQPCFAALFANKHAGDIEVEEQGKILAHELGHYLGLFHTKDSGIFRLGEVFDVLADTPTNVSGSNLMDPGIHDEHPSISLLQGQMLRLSPALR